MSKMSQRGGAKSARLMYTPKASDRKSYRKDSNVDGRSVKSMRSNYNTKPESPISTGPKHMEQPTAPYNSN